MEGLHPQKSWADQLFRHTQLETVKAWMIHPDYAGLPLHSRIQRAIRQLILDGALTAGKPLPATRGLAASLRVSRDTVENAYGQLHAEGFVIRRVGSGSFVARSAIYRLQPPGGARSFLKAADALPFDL